MAADCALTTPNLTASNALHAPSYKKNHPIRADLYLAEREGFEPSRPLPA